MNEYHFLSRGILKVEIEDETRRRNIYEGTLLGSVLHSIMKISRWLKLGLYVNNNFSMAAEGIHINAISYYLPLL